MIEDKELGLKVAENPEEAFWTKYKEQCTKDIVSDKRAILINEHIIDLCVQKLEPYSKA